MWKSRMKRGIENKETSPKIVEFYSQPILNPNLRLLWCLPFVCLTILTSRLKRVDLRWAMLWKIKISNPHLKELANIFTLEPLQIFLLLWHLYSINFFGIVCYLFLFYSPFSTFQRLQLLFLPIFCLRVFFFFLFSPLSFSHSLSSLFVSSLSSSFPPSSFYIFIFPH